MWNFRVHLKLKIMEPLNQNLMNQDEEVFTFANISKEEVRTMVRTHHDFSKKDPKYDYSTHVKCVWFPRAQIEHIASRLVTENASGLRVYFGRYPNSTNTVIFVSTGNGKKDYFKEEYQLDMLPENRGEQCQPTCDGVEFINE